MPTSANIKFLLVDDLAANLDALEGLLRRDHLECLKASSGFEALELLLIHEVALALIDVQMPGMDGFELAELMRGTEATKSVPIIFLTAGSVDQQRRIRGYEAGAIDFLPKPIDPDSLLNKAAVFFQLARQRQELQASQERLARTNAELEHAVHSRDKFLALLGHELRNPLAPLLTGVEMLADTGNDPALFDRLVPMMQRQIGQMVHLIDDLLDVSRITIGKIELQIEPVPVGYVVVQALESIQPMLDRFGHELVVDDIPAELEVMGDPHRLAQIVSNLLSNACKYTPEGGRIEVRVAAEPDGRIQIVVADNGRGIKPEFQPRIFDLFEQGDSGSRDGLGLGLTLVKSIVELHGGTVSLHSEGEGQGSKFTVELPGSYLAEGSTGTAGTVTGKAARLRVLIAEDGRVTADTLQMFFDLEGMETRVVYDGKEAVAVAAEFNPDLVCMDLDMPVMDGFDAARQVRKSCPDAYLVAISGWGGEEIRQRAISSGFDEKLVKPVATGALRELLAKLSP